MHGERNDGFAGEIIGIEQRVQWHRQYGVPDGESDEERVVALEIGDAAGQFRFGVIAHLVDGEFDELVMIGRILLNRVDAEHISTGLLLNEAGDKFDVAVQFAIAHHAARAGLGVGAGRLGHGEVDDQRVAGGYRCLLIGVGALAAGVGRRSSACVIAGCRVRAAAGKHRAGEHHSADDGEGLTQNDDSRSVRGSHGSAFLQTWMMDGLDDVEWILGDGMRRNRRADVMRPVRHRSACGSLPPHTPCRG